jgi:ribosomal protein L21E
VPDIPWFVYAMVLSPFALILLAVAYKYLQVRAARNWPSTPGKVVVSASEVRTVEVLDDQRSDHKSSEQRNFANIVYQYSVRGQSLTSNHVAIGEDRGNVDVAGTLARYPVGKAVAVYYNPNHPQQSVLERDLPKGTGGCLAISSVIVLLIVFGGAIGGKRINDVVASHLADPKLSVLVMALGAFGLFTALFGLAFHRRSALARTWPVVPGTVKLTAPEIYQAADSESGHTGAIMYRRQVLYTYQFDHIAYTGTHGSDSSSARPDAAAPVRLMRTSYRNGDKVKVFVNPQNPTDTTLSPGGGAAWALWTIALLFGVAAFYVATHG